MTILQRSTFVGTEHADVRPGAYSATDTLEGIVKDQAYLYERITGLAVPDAASASATGHDHTGAGDGAIIRLPICQQYMGALLPRQPSNPVSGGTNYAGWSKLIWHPFYCEPGLDKMMCVLWVDRETYAYNETFRAIMMDSSLALIGTYQVSNGLRDYLISENDRIGMVFTLETIPDAVNVLVIEGWDGYYHPTVPVDTSTVGELMPDFRRVLGFTLSPEIQRPNRELRQYSQSTVTTASTTTPAAFISFDDELVQDDVGLSSYHLVSLAKDDAMLQELSTGNPAGNNAATVVDGHNHQGGTTLATCGVPLQRTVGSWFYGTIRTPLNGIKAEYGDLDTIGAGTIANQWTGGVNAITINSSAGTTTRTVATHFFRMPELTAAQMAASTGSVNVVVMVYADTSKCDLTIGVAIGEATGLVFGTEDAHTFTTLGRHVYTFRAVDASLLGSGGVGGSLRIRMTNSSNTNGASFLYGSSVWIEP
jgi:hypothetical protein